MLNIESPEDIAFIAGAQGIINDWIPGPYNPSRPNGPDQLSMEQGPRYIRVVRTSGPQRSAHCFIDRTTGDVLKTASWKTPAKHARGNILREDKGLTCMGPFGAAYLR